MITCLIDNGTVWKFNISETKFVYSFSRYFINNWLIYLQIRKNYSLGAPSQKPGPVNWVKLIKPI